ncbi:MAG: restriction endonuclease subunit S [Chthoniobacteraceae bacterium]
MKRWPTKKLGELLKIQNGFAFKSELFNGDTKGLPIIRIRDLARGFSETFYNGEHDRAFEVENGDFLIGMDGEFRCYRWAGGKALLNQRVCRLQNFSRDLSAGYVFYGINAHLREIEDNTSFVTVKHLSSKQIADIGMPVPPLVQQERIVKLLDEADELRKLRAQADRRTAALLPALFHEMFGDPIENPKGWAQSSFAEVGKLDRGRSKNRPRDEPSLYGGKYPFIQSGDVANSNGRITTHTQTYSENGLAQSRLWPVETLVITIAANIGKTAILTFPACFPDSMVGFIPGEKVLVDYVRQWLVTMESRLEEAAPQMAQKNINLKILSELTIPVPPLPLQKEFAQRVSEIREMEAAQAASRRRPEALFQSLLHRAFNGEL